MKSGVQIVTDNLREMTEAIHALTSSEVLVGIPEDKTERADASGMTNAALLYIHDTGSPAANIPQREVVAPGIRNAQPEIERRLKEAANNAFAGNLGAVKKGLNAVGIVAQNAIRAKITSGPFAPLAPGTVRARKRRFKSRSNTDIKPLIDTGKMRQAVSYVVREKE